MKDYQIDKRPDGVKRWRMRCRKAGIEGRRYATRAEAVDAGEAVQREYRQSGMEGHQRINASEYREWFEIKNMHDSLVKEFGEQNPLVPYTRKIKPSDLTEYGMKLVRALTPFKGRGATSIDSVIAKVEAIMEAEVRAIELPTYADIADEFLGYLLGRDARKTRTKVADPQYLINMTGTFNNRILPAIRSLKVSGGKQELYDLIDNQKTQAGKDYSENSKHHMASVVKRLGEWLEKKGHNAENIFGDMVSKYPMDTNPAQAKTYTVEDVEKLFSFLVTSEKHQHMIPFFALSAFGTFRPMELIGQCRHSKLRRFNYSQLQGFHKKGNYNNDVWVFVPQWTEREDEHGKMMRHKAGKTPDRQASLADTGVQWIKYYHETLLGKEVPNPDKPYWRTRLDVTFSYHQPSLPNSVYMQTGLSKIKNGFRHTICSMQYAMHSDIGYFSERSGHTLKHFKNHYLNAMVTRDDAVRYFKITPDYILDKIAAAHADTNKAAA
jgi:hypothetical protein